MTLTEFLLARIAEDEAAARRVAVVGSCEPGYRPARVLAECEAKRRIVKTAEGGLTSSSAAVQFLAAVYSDHPDYRAEWAL